MGYPSFLLLPPTSLGNVSDNGLAALVDVHVLHSHLLLAGLAAMGAEGLHLPRENPNELGGAADVPDNLLIPSCDDIRGRCAASGSLSRLRSLVATMTQKSSYLQITLSVQ